MMLDTLLIILLIILLLCTAFWTYLLLYTLYYKVPPISTSPTVVKAALKLAEIKPGQQVVELGCGWARFSFTAQASHPKAHYLGYDVLWPLIAYNRWRARGKIVFKKTDFFTENLTQADVIYCYLWDSIMSDFYQKKWAELKPGCRVISHDFPIQDLQPQQTVQCNASTLYLYVKN